MENNNQCNITEEEKQELVELTSEYQNILMGLGELQAEELSLKAELKNLKHERQKYKKHLLQFKSKEKLYSERLTKKYGDGELDISSGVYLKR